MEVGVTVAATVLKTTLPKLLKVISEELGQVQLDAGFLQRELQLIQALIRDKPWIISHFHRLVLAVLRCLADDIEECIDRFHIGKMTRRQFAREIGVLKDRAKQTREQLTSYIYINLATSGSGSSAPPSSHHELAPPPPAGRIVDMKDAEQELVALVQSDSEEKLKVISIVGLDGVPPGMTQLAKQVYEGDVGRQFGCRAWVSAAGKCAKEILDQLNGVSFSGTTNTKSEEELQQEIEIQEYVLSEQTAVGNGVHENGGEHGRDTFIERWPKNERFLIVIDDVAADELYNVVSAFPWTDGIGRTIILTTNIQSAGTRCICGKGLALAQCSSTSQFFKILELTESKFEEGYTLRAKLEEMLVSNYESLAGLGLQDLLLYFCMFPCDHPVRRNPLIRRWLAEEIVFIEPEDARSSPEEVAFNTLINRNIIQPVQVSNTGKVKRCRPYEIMLEIMLDSVSRKKSASNNFITLVCGRTGQEPSCVRRLSLHPSRAAANRRLKLPKDLSRLRTLAVFPAANLDNYKDTHTLKFAKYELLRVLDLKECSHLEEKHLRDICGLLLLKYLSLGETIGKVPQKIRNLQRLETLDMRRTKTVELCLEALQLPKLKHLLGKFQLQEIPNKKLDKFLSDNCDHLVLETLSGFVAERSQGISQQMLFMGQLKKVKIWLDSTVDATSITHLSDAVKMFTSDGNSMASVDRSLSIDFTECSTADCSVRFLESLQAPGKLTSLKLRGDLTQFLDSLPEPEKFVTKLRGIQELCLSSTNLAGAAILAGLVNLRVLKYLKLVEDNLGPLVIQAEHFPCLHRMCLVGVRSLHDVTIQAGALRSLVSLQMLCESLGDLPGIEIKCLQNLTELALHSRVVDGIKIAWRAAARDHANKPNVCFIDC